MVEPQSFRIELLEPDSCLPERLAEFRQLVLEGGQVARQSLPGLLERATALAFVLLEDSVVGVGALKRPNPSYRNNVFAKAKSSLAPAKFDFELGWIYLTPSARSKRLTTPMVKSLLRYAKGRPVYATSRVNKIEMHASLEHSGFTREGSLYPSQEDATDIQLFIRK